MTPVKKIENNLLELVSMNLITANQSAKISAEVDELIMEAMMEKEDMEDTQGDFDQDNTANNQNAGRI